MLLFLGVLGILWFQARHPLWRSHLQADVVTFQARMIHFLQQSSWENLGYNEYQPSALWFFVLLGWIVPQAHQFENYLLGIMIVNASLMLAHFLFFLKWGYKHAALIFSFLLLAMGPILFFRFELWVTLFVLLFWKAFFRDEQPRLGAVYLGLATSFKIYPVLLLPLVWIKLFQNKKWREGFEISSYFVIATLFPVVTWLALGGTWDAFWHAITVHKLKPIGLEGPWALGLMIWEKLGQHPYQLVGNYGISGLHISELPWLDPLLNWFWVIPVALFYRSYAQSKKSSLTSVEVLFLIILSFVMLTKSMQPQYLWWAFALMPLWVLKPSHGQKRALCVVIMSIGALILTQLVYPLNYTPYLAEFQTHHPDKWFGTSLIRNILLITVWITTPFMTKEWKLKKTKLRPLGA